MRGSGRQRWKRIKGLARLGPIAAFESWCNASSGFDRCAKKNGEDIAYMIYGRIRHDRAVAVRLSQSLLSRSEHEAKLRGARSSLAERGIEVTPQDMKENLEQAYTFIGERLALLGYPMPDCVLAKRDLLSYLYRQGKAGAGV